MIPSFHIIVLWLAMTGQGDTRKIVDAYAEAPCKGLELQCNPFGGEHVIEIRTKRVTKDQTAHIRSDAPKGAHLERFCADGYEAETVIAYNPKFQQDLVWEKAGVRCVRVTKTLYIDGQKIGVIRETEEK